MKIIYYNTSNDILVQFQDSHKHIVHTVYSCFNSGNVKNPYDTSVSNVGCIGNTITRDTNGVKKSYYVWKAMIRRCYKSIYKSYDNVSVCEDWLCYENFEKWYDANYWECGEEIMCLDKDILSGNNKTYSHQNCIFVPNRINLLFQSIQDIIKNGTRYNKKDKRYIVYVTHMEHNVNDYFGSYKTKEESIEIYLKHKKLYIKQVANEYNNKYTNFPNKIYQAMIDY